ncbi:UNVERIFIED_CONTAM: acetylornithine deacetylase [Brevibacillus sp. OAP136]
MDQSAKMTSRFPVDEKKLMNVLRSLIEINSVNPYLSHDGHGESEIAEYIQGVLQGMNLEIHTQQLTEKAVNVIGIWRGTGGGKSLLLNGHTDTVGVSNMQIPPFVAEVREGRVYGRGSCDMKGSLAAMILAVDTLQRTGYQPAGDVILTFVADEEYKSIGTEALVKSYSADAAIVCEPSDLTAVVAHKGFVWITVEVHGKAAHGSRPAEGIDAIVKAGKLLAELEMLSRDLERKQHPILGVPSIHASLISGGTEISTYPDYCRIELERRTIPGEQLVDVTAELDALFRRLKEADDQFQASYEITFVREPFEISNDAPIVQTLQSAYRNYFGEEQLIAGFSGWADSSLIHEAGTPTVIFGPYGAGLHGAVEYVDFDSVVQMTSILAGVIRSFCQGEK